MIFPLSKNQQQPQTKTSYITFRLSGDGETEDTFIADFAVGIGASQFKAGAPCRGERVAKYNQIMRIEGELSPAEAKYAGGKSQA